LERTGRGPVGGGEKKKRVTWTYFKGEISIDLPGRGHRKKTSEKERKRRTGEGGGAGKIGKNRKKTTISGARGKKNGLTERGNAPPRKKEKNHKQKGGDIKKKRGYLPEQKGRRGTGKRRKSRSRFLRGGINGFYGKPKKAKGRIA